jgi:acyl dehydratase
MKHQIGKSSLSTESATASTRPAFDPTSFLVVPPKRFDDLKVGDIFRAPSRTLTDAHASAFQVVSADNHPVHYDKEWAARHGHSAPVVHGLQVLAFTAPGATLFPHYIGETFIAFTELSCKFLKEVHAGDTLYSTLEIADLVREGENGVVTTDVTIFNQKGELVLSGWHKYLLKAG